MLRKIEGTHLVLCFLEKGTFYNQKPEVHHKAMSLQRWSLNPTEIQEVVLT